MNNQKELIGRLLVLLGSVVLCGVVLGAPRTFPTVTDTAYRKEGGTCHMAFPPQLMPARSWRGVMGSLDAHFGDSAQLDTPTHRAISDYLATNAADGANNAESIAIMASIDGGATPDRISKVDHFGESIELNAEVNARLREYLNANAADKVPERGAAVLLERLDPEKTPMRITQVPHILKMHIVVREVLKTNATEKVRSLANCDSCHQKATEGSFALGDLLVPGVTKVIRPGGAF